MASGTWRRLTISPPLDVQVGDVLSETDGTLIQTRNGAVITTRMLELPGEEHVPEPATVAQTISSVFYFEEKRMPGVMATMTDVSVNQMTGAINFVFSDGSGLQFADIASVENDCGYDIDPDFPKRLLCMIAARNSPDGANLSTMVGASCSADFLADVPIVVTRPV